MQAVATEMQTWITVRCPCRKNILGEVRGTGGEVLRRCQRCGGWWVIDCATGKVHGADPVVVLRSSA